MTTPVYLKVSKTIHHPLDKVWETVALEFGDVAKYNPEIKTSRFDPGQRRGIGTIRHCDFKNSGYIKEEIIEWTDRQSFKLRCKESSVPLAHLESLFHFEAGNNQTTTVTQEFWYRMKAPLGWMSGIMKKKMKATLINGLNGLENYLNQK